MFEGTHFKKTTEILQRTADVSALRRRVIANNIANAETPNFKRSDVSFEAELKRALDSEKIRTLPARMNHVRHIAFHRPRPYAEVRPRRMLDYLTEMKSNGNNVDIEQETIHALSNQMRYELLMEGIRFQFGQIRSVLT